MALVEELYGVIRFFSILYCIIVSSLIYLFSKHRRPIVVGIRLLFLFQTSSLQVQVAVDAVRVVFTLCMPEECRGFSIYGLMLQMFEETSSVMIQAEES